MGFPLNFQQTKTSGKNLSYMRISTVDQKIDRQEETLARFNIDKCFIDKVSGGTLSRPQLETLIDYCREGDHIYIASIDRLARNLQHLISLIDIFNRKQVVIHFIKENLVFNGDDTPISKLVLHVIGAVAEFEKTLIKERQKEGIDLAKKAGKYKGKPKKYSAKIIEKIIYELKTTRITKTELAKKYNISRTQLYKYINDFKNNSIHIKQI